jgi:hypothetical protein
MDLVLRLDALTYGLVSGSPLILMVQPTHDRTSNHLVPCILRGRNRSAPSRNLLRNPLMWSCLIEVDHIGIEHALELLLLKDQQVIETFLPYAPQEAFADGISAWRMNRRSEDPYRARFRHTSKARPKFAIVIPNQILGSLSIGGGFSQLLRHPGIGRQASDADVDPPSLTSIR